jgi:hypothetical protein
MMTESPYFIITPDSVEIPVTDITARETPNPERVRRALDLMMDAKAGKIEKRMPILVVPIGNGGYRVVDGNSTLQALKELQERIAVVTIVGRE